MHRPLQITCNITEELTFWWWAGGFAAGLHPWTLSAAAGTAPETRHVLFFIRNHQSMQNSDHNHLDKTGKLAVQMKKSLLMATIYCRMDRYKLITLLNLSAALTILRKDRLLLNRDTLSKTYLVEISRRCVIVWRNRWQELWTGIREAILKLWHLSFLHLQHTVTMFLTKLGVDALVDPHWMEDEADGEQDVHLLILFVDLKGHEHRLVHVWRNLRFVTSGSLKSQCLFIILSHLIQ